MHYQRKRRHGDVLTQIAKGRHAPTPVRSCDREGCINPHFAKGLCNKHYWRAKRGNVFYQRQRKRLDKAKAVKQKAQTKSTVEYLRTQVGWADDPTPYNWRLAALGPNDEEIATDLWDWKTVRNDEETERHPDVSQMMNSPCPTIQNLIDKALEGEAMHVGERAILASTLRRYQSL